MNKYLKLTLLMFALGARLIGSPVQAEYNDHSFTSEEVTASSYVNYFKYMVSSISYNSLSMACYYGCLDVLKNQIGSLENINGEYGQGYGLLHWAAQGGHVPVIEFLIDHGAVVNIIDRNHGSLPLHEAVRMGHYSAVKALLKKGSDVTTKNIFGLTPSNVAANKWAETNDEKYKKILDLLDKEFYDRFGDNVSKAYLMYCAFELLKVLI